MVVLVEVAVVLVLVVELVAVVELVLVVVVVVPVLVEDMRVLLVVIEDSPNAKRCLRHGAGTSVVQGNGK